MSWLDKILTLTVEDDGVAVAQTQTLNFIGATVTDDPENTRVNVTVDAPDLSSPGPIGDVTPNAGAFTELSLVGDSTITMNVSAIDPTGATAAGPGSWATFVNTIPEIDVATPYFKKTDIGTSGWARVHTEGAPIGDEEASTGAFTSLNVSGLTASKYVVTDGSKNLASQTGIPRADIVNTSGATGDLLVGNGTALDRLAIGSSGQILTVSSGAPVWAAAPSGGGPYNALNASTTHQYKLDETSGNFANSVTGAADPLTPSPSTSFFYQDPNLFSRGTYGVRCLAAGVNDGANSTSLTTSLASGCTIECILGPLDLIPYASAMTILEISNSTRNNGLIQLSYDTSSSPGHLRATIYTSAAGLKSSIAGYKPGGRIHLAAVYDHVSKTVSIWVNGIAATASSALDLTGVQMNWFTVGNNTVGAGAYRGLIADVRITSAVLTASYFQAATKAMGAL